MPLVRYRNRDISRLIERKCRCGLKSIMLDKIRGRLDEMVVASGGNLYPLMFEKMLDDIEGITKDWQIVFKLNGIKEVMEINLEAKDESLKERDFFKDKVFERMKYLYPDLWKNYDIGIFDIKFSIHAPNDLRKQKRKLRRLIDERCKTY
jgi:phenylacetate-CoA ligase